MNVMDMGFERRIRLIDIDGYGDEVEFVLSDGTVYHGRVTAEETCKDAYGRTIQPMEMYPVGRKECQQSLKI